PNYARSGRASAQARIVSEPKYRTVKGAGGRTTKAVSASPPPRKRMVASYSPVRSLVDDTDLIDAFAPLDRPGRPPRRRPRGGRAPPPIETDNLLFEKPKKGRSRSRGAEH